MQLQLTLDPPDDDGRRTLTIHSRVQDPDDESEQGTWLQHAAGILTADSFDDQPAEAGKDSSWPPADAERIPTDDFYQQLADLGFGYGPGFRGLRAAWRVGDEVFAEVVLPEDQAQCVGGFGVHPALFDAGLHALGLLVPVGVSGG
ncbi:polyketide synthase dehydratase domain-containing protein, partial [Streptomyces sp. SAJ15]|uniref:polyketide synthase dehydratase domain-containing protein n=1 Tax=Streptomyces sp. SAJ15 TaxID=2011095 RepID=UPI0037D9FBF4